MNGCRAASGWAGFRGRVKALVLDRAGGVAVIFGLTLVPLAFAVGAGLDYSRASDARTRLQAASDAAALSVVTSGSLSMTAAQARSNAIDLFNGSASMAKFATNVGVTVTVVDLPAGRQVKVAFTADVPTTISRIAGFSTIPVAGTSTSASAPPVYVDFHMLLDNTPSMGVGATTADINTMVANTSDQCAFACHDLSAGGNDYYAKAKKLGVQMRIDVVRTATQQLMDTAAATSVVPGQFRASVHTFGTVCGSGLNLVSPLTSNLAGVKISANAVDLMATPSQNYNNDQCTDYDGTLASINQFIGTPGDGSTALTPQKVVFFVADGVADAYYPSTCSKATTNGRCQEPINLAGCQTLKARGVKVAVLYTTYLPLPTNGWYMTWINPFANSISPQMQSCASPGLFFEVTPSQGISDAMAAMFQTYLAQSRIST